MAQRRQDAVTVRGLTVELGGRRALDDVSLGIPWGSLTVLVGPNGAGKSTLLGAIAGDVRPSGGEILLEGRPLDSYGVRELSRHRAMMTQQYGVTFPFTVREVVLMGRNPWRGTPEENRDEDVIDAALGDADMNGFEGRRYTELSGGEKARVAFARVLAQECGVVLLDEPTAALDLAHQEQVLGRARRVAATGGSVIVVVHDLTLAAAYADSVVLLSKGRLVGMGAPEEVLTESALEEVYGLPVDVIHHPVDGRIIVLPHRA